MWEQGTIPNMWASTKITLPEAEFLDVIGTKSQKSQSPIVMDFFSPVVF
jgi:hypothetical protein